MDATSAEVADEGPQSKPSVETTVVVGKKDLVDELESVGSEVREVGGCAGIRDRVVVSVIGIEDIGEVWIEGIIDDDTELLRDIVEVCGKVVEVGIGARGGPFDSPPFFASGVFSSVTSVGCRESSSALTTSIKLRRHAVNASGMLFISNGNSRGLYQRRKRSK